MVGNQLRILPPDVGRLTNLRVLAADSNQLTILPGACSTVGGRRQHGGGMSRSRTCCRLGQGQAQRVLLLLATWPACATALPPLTSWCRRAAAV